MNSRPSLQFPKKSIFFIGLFLCKKQFWLLKARHAAQITGLPISDDSGLTVDALKGAPGVYSARYAGTNDSDQENIKKLLIEMKGIPDDQRGAQFHCLLVYLRHSTDACPLVFYEKCSGRIVTSYEASKNAYGFGYDPVFYLLALKRTAAELRPEEKSAISHRGQALQQLLHALKNA